MSMIGDIKTVTARKAHLCWWCGERIEPGTKYRRWSCADGDEIVTAKAHPECEAAWASLPIYDQGDVPFAVYNRGCTCDSGQCVCNRNAENAEADA